MPGLSIENTGKINSLHKVLQEKRSELLDILAEKEKLVKIVKPKIIYEYELNFGSLEKELQEKNRIAEIYEEEALILMTKAKRGEKISKNILLETKRKIHQRIINKKEKQDEKTKSSKINTAPSPKNTAEIQKMFRAIAKIIHPDLNKGTNPFSKHWDAVFDAYQSNDSAKIIAYYNLICSDEDSQNKQIQLRTLEQRINKLQRSIDFERRKLQRMKLSEPYVLADIFNDEIKKKQREEQIKHKITQCERSIEMSIGLLNAIGNNDKNFFENDEDVKFQEELKDKTYIKI